MATLTSPSDNILPFLTIRLKEMDLIPIKTLSNNTITVHGLTDADLQSLINEVSTTDYQLRVLMETKYGVLPNKNLFLERITTVSDLRAHVRGAILTQANAMREAAFNDDPDVTTAEPSAWDLKALTAERVIADTASAEELEIIQLEADLRGLGETVLELAVKQMENSTRFRKARAIIDGITRAKLNEAETKSTTVELKQVYSSHASDIVLKLEQLDDGTL